MSALNAVHYQNLANVFHVGVERVRREAQVPRDTIVLLLPEAEMNAAARATAEPHQRAVAVWNEHQSSLSALVGGFIDGLVEAKLGIPNLGIGNALNGFLRDARLEGPFTELQAALLGYDQWLQWAASMLDGDAALAEAHKRAQRRRRVMKAARVLGIAGVVGLGGLGIHWAVADPQGAVSAGASAAVTPPPSPVAPPATATLVPSTSTARPTTHPTSSPAHVPPIVADAGDTTVNPPAAPSPASRAACLRIPRIVITCSAPS